MEELEIKYSEIPLVKELIDSYNSSIDGNKINKKEFNIYDHIDKRMLDIYNSLKNIDEIILTDIELYNYIKFIDFSTMNTSNYKNIVKYINDKNINIIFELFNNINILDNLYPLLNYKMAADYEFFEENKEIWFSGNVDWLEKNKPELLESYCVFSSMYNYYNLNNNIIMNDNYSTDGENFILVSNNGKNIKMTNLYIDLIISCSTPKSFQVVKHIIVEIKKSIIIYPSSIISEKDYSSVYIYIAFTTLSKLNDYIELKDHNFIPSYDMLFDIIQLIQQHRKNNPDINIDPNFYNPNEYVKYINNLNSIEDNLEILKYLNSINLEIHEKNIFNDTFDRFISLILSFKNENENKNNMNIELKKKILTKVHTSRLYSYVIKYIIIQSGSIEEVNSEIKKSYKYLESIIEELIENIK